EALIPANVVTDLADIQAKIIAGELCTGWPEPCAPAAGSIGTPDNPIKVLFVPSVDAQVIVSGGEIMKQALEEATGFSYEVVVPTSYAATIEEMCAAPDRSIGFIPGLGYVLANQLCGVDVSFKAIRFGWDVYWAQLLVQRDSDIQTLADLEGKTWGYPDAGSTSGYLAVLPMLAAAGVEIPEGNRVETGGHTGSVRAVYNGEVDFSSSFFSPPLKPDPAWARGDAPDIPDDILDTCAPNADGSRLFCGPGQEWRVLDARAGLRQEAPDVVQKTRILAISPDIPNDTLSFSPDFPADVRAQIEAALVAFAETDAWDTSIGNQDFYGWTGLSPATDEEYDVVRQMIELSGMTMEDLGQ
ncbi:MAG: PhnD/SsuA/transferrin family substrate-binding protein, partial [Caldilineales bacterium]|nr:PhnD/SsuA/transferrin family substrate-binding protein [Caldilineales bacterium]